MDCENLLRMMKETCLELQSSAYLSEPMHMLISEIRRLNCILLMEETYKQCGGGKPLRRTSYSQYGIEQRACGTHSKPVQKRPSSNSKEMSSDDK